MPLSCASLAALVGDLVGLLRVVGILLDVRDHLLHRRRSLFGRRRLRAGALRHLDRGRRDGLAGSRHLAGNRADIGDRLRQPGHHRRQRLHQLVLRRALPDGHRQVAVGNLLGRRGDVVHGHDQRVQVVLDVVEVAVVGVGDLRGHIALGDQVHIPRGHVQRADDRVQRVVYALHDLAIVALVLAGIGAGGQFAVHRRLDQRSGIGDQRIDGVDAGVEVVLDGVEVAVVGVGDLGGNVAPADAIHVIGGHIQRADDRVQRVVYALHDLAIVALVLAGVGAGGQFAVHRRFYQHAGIGNQRVDRVDAGVQVVLDGVEVAVVRVGDLGGNVALADSIHVVGSHVQRTDHRVQNVVDAAHDLGIGALELSCFPRSESWPSVEASVSRASSFCRPCRTSATLLMACFIFS